LAFAEAPISMADALWVTYSCSLHTAFLEFLEGGCMSFRGLDELEIALGAIDAL
jgi:hypothetical protein